MRWSQYYIHTTREVPSDAEVVSHQLMVRAGMIKKVAAGIYTYLPTGWRSLRKLIEIIRREVERAGSVELSMPAVQPAELWYETGRWDVYGHLLLRMKDRHERDFCIGPTHEEVVTDLVRRDIRSYRQLPVNLFQIQTKFRDEIRPRFGLMRGREFLMKDAYSFHATAESLDEAYQSMRAAYARVIDSCRLEYIVVEADSGAIGGAESHEFMVLAETGEDAVTRCPACGYAANVERAMVRPLEAPPADTTETEKVATPGATTVAEVAEMLDVEPSRIVKTLVYETEGDPVVAVTRGDREINETKLANYLNVQHLKLAGDAAVVKATGAPAGFVGPVGLPGGLRVVGDESARELAGFVCGANERDAHLRGVQWGRDVDLAEWTDLLLAVAGDGCPRCDDTLEEHRGIEVGHVFKLGTKYSSAMGCLFTDDQGVEHPMIMGCYGMGVGRMLAAAIEQNHDADGIIWPLPLAPFEALVIPLNAEDTEIRRVAETIYDELLGRNVDVLFDDRAERPGVKFKDADLLGIPVRIVIGKKSLSDDRVEISLRRDREKQMTPTATAVARVLELLLEGAAAHGAVE